MGRDHACPVAVTVGGKSREDRIRLQRFLARCGLGSRRGCEAFVLAGRVRVNGAVVRTLGATVDPVRDLVEVDGRRVRPARRAYLLLHKPAGYVTTRSDPQGRPTVMDLLGPDHAALFPVGRLDVDTEGALILTNDGEFAHRLLHPSFEIPRTYEAWVEGRPGREVLAALAGGVVLDGRRTAPAKARVLVRRASRTLVEIVLHEGRKRQVRRMFQALGHPVRHLKRTAYGPVRLGRLAKGRYRRLRSEELRLLDRLALANRSGPDRHDAQVVALDGGQRKKGKKLLYKERK